MKLYFAYALKYTNKNVQRGNFVPTIFFFSPFFNYDILFFISFAKIMYKKIHLSIDLFMLK